MGMKCPACGGYLEFDIESQKLKCTYCGSFQDPQKYNLKNEADRQSVQKRESAEQISVDVYSCKNCGAELCAPNEQVVAFCMYCGGQATLLRKAASIRKPVGIIPFEISKKKVCELYSKKIDEFPFVPRSFKKSEFLEGFRGIYIPYWKFCVKVNSYISIKGAGTRSKYGIYEASERYDVKAWCVGSIDSGTYDASEAFDDTIAFAISPYKEASIIPFNEAYLSGFYADMATVEPNAYDYVLREDFPKIAQSEIRKHLNGIEPDIKEVKSQIKFQKMEAETFLFPVWFLTWRKGKRVCYSVMNGQSGELSIDLPVDYMRFFRYAIVMSFIVVNLMDLLPVFIIPFKVATASSFLLYFSSFIFNRELKKICQIETHYFDVGSSLRKNKELKETSTGLLVLDVLHYLAAFLMVIPAFLVTTSEHVLKFFILMLSFQLIVFIRQCKSSFGIKNGIGIIPAFISLFVQVAGVVVAYNDIQADIYYYDISICCLVAMIINIVTSVFYMNYLTTRPAPNFYTREGAKNGR